MSYRLANNLRPIDGHSLTTGTCSIPGMECIYHATVLEFWLEHSSRRERHSRDLFVSQKGAKIFKKDRKGRIVKSRNVTRSAKTKDN